MGSFFSNIKTIKNNLINNNIIQIDSWKNDDKIDKIVKEYIKKDKKIKIYLNILFYETNIYDEIISIFLQKEENNFLKTIEKEIKIENNCLEIIKEEIIKNFGIDTSSININFLERLLTENCSIFYPTFNENDNILEIIIPVLIDIRDFFTNFYINTNLIRIFVDNDNLKNYLLNIKTLYNISLLSATI